GDRIVQRRAFIGGVAADAVLGPRAAYAQTPAKARRIGLLMTTTPAAAAHIVTAFADGLRDLGHSVAEACGSGGGGHRDGGQAAGERGRRASMSTTLLRRRSWRLFELRHACLG